MSTIEEPTLEQINEKLDEIIDEKYNKIFDSIKAEIDGFSYNTPGHQINAALKRYFS